MTGRPQLGIGQHGDIWVSPNKHGKFKARVNVRDRDGRTREVTATAATRGAAKRELQRRLDSRQPTSGIGLTPNMTLEEAAAHWLEHRVHTGLAKQQGALKVQTLGAYEGAIRLLLVPSLGGVRICETTVGLLDAVLAELEACGQSTAQLRSVLHQILSLAVRHEALTANPMGAVASLRREPKEVEALTVAEAQTLRHLVAPETRRRPGNRGPNRDLQEVIDALLGTGTRIGEVLAIQWFHLDLHSDLPTMEISGTLVESRRGYVKHLHRQDTTKSKTNRRLVLCDALVESLLERQARSKHPNPEDPVFATRTGNWIAPSFIRTRLREAIAGHELEGTTPHTLRRTVGTLIAHSPTGGLQAARDQLGHKHPGITAELYVAPLEVAPDLRHLFDLLLPPHN